jgi:hypothetical protein
LFVSGIPPLHQHFEEANMKKQMIGLTAAGLLLSWLGAPALLQAGTEERINESFQVKPGGMLTLNSEMGSVEIRTHSADRVDVRVIKKSRRAGDKKALSEFYIRMDKNGDDVDISGDFTRKGINRLWSRLRNRLRVSYIITVPRKYDLDLQTTGGGIEVDPIDGMVSARSTGGGLRLETVGGNLMGRTTGGGIVCRSVEGDADLGTTGGGIETGYIRGSIKAHTTGGSIRIKEADGFIRAKTTGGSIQAGFARQPLKDCYLKTTGGAVTLYLDTKFGFDLNARTTGGRISSDFPMTLDGLFDKKAISARLNGGGPELYIRTTGGGITLKSR